MSFGRCSESKTRGSVIGGDRWRQRRLPHHPSSEWGYVLAAPWASSGASGTGFAIRGGSRFRVKSSAPTVSSEPKWRQRPRGGFRRRTQRTRRGLCRRSPKGGLVPQAHCRRAGSATPPREPGPGASGIGKPPNTQPGCGRRSFGAHRLPVGGTVDLPMPCAQRGCTSEPRNHLTMGNHVHWVLEPQRG